MYIGSRIVEFFDKILAKIQEKTEFLTNNSAILKNMDVFLFIMICLSAVCSIFMSNNFVAPLLCIVAVLFGLTMILDKNYRLKIEKSSLFLILYFVLAIASTINSTMPHQSLTGLSKTILYLLYFWATLQYLRVHKDKIPCFALIIGACVSFEIVIAFIQNYLDVLSAATWQDTARLNPELVLTRVYGTLKPSNPNLFGGYLIAAVPFLWLYTALNFVEKHHKRFLISLIFSILAIPAVFMTGCRGAYIALFFMIITMLVATYNICKFHYPKVYDFVKKYLHIIMIAGISACCAIMVCVPKISHRILSIFAMRNDSSTSFRMNVYHSAWQMFQDNVLLGIGCGNKVFREVYGLYMLSGFDALSAYSIYLETAVESGIFALIFYLLFIFFLIKDGLIAFFGNCDIKKKLYLTAGITGIIGVLSHGFVDTVYFRPQIQLIFWITVAIVMVCSDFQKSEFEVK
ncbi:MAG: O-antigen ligase family protein [bacterium]|nr:O-antigen ligase family protein [bacterium]